MAASLDWIELGIAGIALLMSGWAAHRAYRVSGRQTALQERMFGLESVRERDRIAGGRKADLRAEIAGGSPNWKLYIVNEGPAEARSIEVRADGVPLPEHEVIMTSEDGVVTMLGPGAQVSYPMAVAMGSALKYLVELSWEDGTDNRRQWRSELTI